MIWILARLGLSKASLAGTLAILVGAFALGTYTGNTLAIKYYKAKEVAALNAQIAHNEKVIVWSRKEIQKLHDEELRLEELVRTLNEEANTDPDRDKPSINLDGVRRLNRASLLSGANSPTGLGPYKAVRKARPTSRTSPKSR